MLYEITIDGKNHHLQLERAGGGWRCRLDGLLVIVDAALNRPNVLSVLMNPLTARAKIQRGKIDLVERLEDDDFGNREAPF